MNYVSVAKMAEKWGISERSVRNYCAEGRIPGAFITGKTWNIPENAEITDIKYSSKKSDDILTSSVIIETTEKENHQMEDCFYANH